MSQAPEVCECRFCGESHGPAGITNHETFCDESPNPGVPVEKQQELGLLDGEESGEVPESEASTADPDPDQRSRDSGDGLPPRRNEAGDKKDTGSETTEENSGACENCGSDNTIPTHQARKGFESELGTLPDELRATLDATETYCNECWHVEGGELSNPYPIMENPEGGSA